MAASPAALMTAVECVVAMNGSHDLVRRTSPRYVCVNAALDSDQAPWVTPKLGMVGLQQILTEDGE